MMNKKEGKKKFSFKEIFTNKQYRAIAILIFYAILFAVLIIGMKMPKRGLDSVINNGSNLEGYDLIDNNNFGYRYTVTVDDKVYYYNGKKYQDKELVTVTVDEEVREYYFNKDNLYLKENNFYIPMNIKPFILFDFFDTSILDRLILRSQVIDEINHKYSIDNQNIYDLLMTDTARIESGDNYIDLVYRNDNITGITFDFSNYAKTTREDYDKIIISLEYYDFNLVDDFEITVSQ